MSLAREPRPNGTPPLDLERVRRDFPILHQEVHGKPLVYLDNAATAQKPQAVLDAVQQFYARDNANIHRGVHALSERATRAYEQARVKAQRFLNAAAAREIVFVRSTTEAINLVARSFAGPRLQPGDEIILSTMEHHSNIVPWQLLGQETGAVLKVVPITDAGELELEAYERLFSPRTRMVALAHASNALGTVNPARRIVEVAHAHEVPVLFDGAQAAPHFPVDVKALGCDFYAFSSHKLYGPTGVGVLYGKAAHLEAMPPYQGGGEMIRSVTFEKTTYHDIPHKFEAGTPNIAGVVGLGAAIDYLQGMGMDRIAAYEQEILAAATAALRRVPGLRLIGTAREKVAVLSFVLGEIHAHDVGTILDREGVAVRTGHHCAYPVMDRFQVPATCRASFALYNTREEIDALVRALTTVTEIFA